MHICKKISIIFILGLVSSLTSFGQTAKDIWQGEFSPSLRNRTWQYITISVDGDKANISFRTQYPADNLGYNPSDSFYSYVGIVDGNVIKIPKEKSVYNQVLNKVKAGKDRIDDFERWLVYTDNGEYYEIVKNSYGKIECRLLEKKKVESTGLTKVNNYKSDKYGFEDQNGNLVIPSLYDDARDFKNGYAAVCIGEKWGMIDSKGTIVLPFKYARVGNYSQGLIPVSDSEDFLCKYYVLLNGKKAFDCSQYGQVYDFLPEGIGRVMYPSGKYSFVDKQGRELLDKDCEQVNYNLTNGHILAKRGGKWGIVNTKGKVVAPYIYDQISEDVYGNSGYFAVKLNGKYGSIDSLNNVKIPIKYQSITIADNDNVVFNINDKYGLMDYNGNIKIQPRKERISATEFGYVSPDEQYYYLFDNDKDGVINNRGIVTIKPKYSRLTIQGRYAYVEEEDGKNACFLNCKDGSTYADLWGYSSVPKSLLKTIGGY